MAHLFTCFLHPLLHETQSRPTPSSATFFLIAELTFDQIESYEALGVCSDQSVSQSESPSNSGISGSEETFSEPNDNATIRTMKSLLTSEQHKIKASI